MSGTIPDTVNDAIPIEVQSALQRVARLSKAFGDAVLRCQDPEARSYLIESGTLFNLAVLDANRRGPNLLDNPQILHATIGAIMTPLNSNNATSARLRDAFSNALFNNIMAEIHQTSPMQCLQTLRAYNRQR